DRNSVAGVVRAHLIKREQKLPLAYHPGARLIFADGTPDILAYPRDRAAWGRLCRLLTRGNLRAEKGECILYRHDFLEHIDGLQLIVMETSTWEHPSPPVLRKPPSAAVSASLLASTHGGLDRRPQGGIRLVANAEKKTGANDLLALLRAAAAGRVRLAAAMLYRGHDRAWLAPPPPLARQARRPPLPGDPLLHH